MREKLRDVQEKQLKHLISFDMKKYELVNVPEGGVKFELSGRRPIILDKNLTDEDAELLLDGGSNKNAAHYIKLKEIPPAIVEQIPPVVVEQKAVVAGKSKEV